MDKIALEAFLYSTDLDDDSYLLASSSSDSEWESECCCSDDSETAEEELRLKKPKLDGFAEITVPFFDNSDFKNNFRVSKATCEKLTELIANEFSSDHKVGWERITPLKAAYVLLWYLGNKETFKQISNRFKITQCCAYNIVKVGSQTLSSKLSQFVRWPEEGHLKDESKGFYNISKISNIIGAIGVSHIKILRPKEDYEKYVNERKYYSIAVQGIVGNKRNFMDIYTCEGSLEAYEILDKSPVSSIIGTDVMGDYFLVGDSCYPNFQWLVTPFWYGDELTPKQLEFNRHIGRATRLVSDAFGKLKERFQRLNCFENKDICSVLKCIEATCVVHNICLDNDDDCEFFSPDPGNFHSQFEFDGDDCERRTRAFEAFTKSSDGVV